MKQFWTIKSNNFDKIVFFKLGKFYELFYEDAFIGHKICDLKWMAKKMHVGFPEKRLEYYANFFVEEFYQVVIVEQVETPRMMEKRLKASGSKKEKTIDRAVV